MSNDQPDLGKGLFGYRKSAVNQIIADRDIMLRQAEGRVRAAESKVAELDTELGSTRERNQRMEEQLERLRTQLDSLMSRTTALEAPEQVEESKPWFEAEPASAPEAVLQAAPEPEAEPTPEHVAETVPEPWAQVQTPPEETPSDQTSSAKEGTWSTEAVWEQEPSEAQLPERPDETEGLPIYDTPVFDETSMFGERGADPDPVTPAVEASSEESSYDEFSYGFPEPATEDAAPDDPDESSRPAWMDLDAEDDPQVETPTSPGQDGELIFATDDYTYGFDGAVQDQGEEPYVAPEESYAASQASGAATDPTFAGEPVAEAADEATGSYGGEMFEPETFGQSDLQDGGVVSPYARWDAGQEEPFSPAVAQEEPPEAEAEWDALAAPEPVAVDETGPEAELAALAAEQPVLEAQAEPVVEASSKPEFSQETSDITNRFLTEELSGILSAAEESASRIVERARTTSQHQIAQSNRLWREVQGEVARFASWREEVEPVIQTVQSKVEGVRLQIEEVPERIRQALAPMADSISSIDADLAELAAACTPPLLLTPSGLEEDLEPAEWGVRASDNVEDDFAYGDFDRDGDEDAGHLSAS